MTSSLPVLVVLVGVGLARADTFDTGGNQFSIDFVTIWGSTNPTDMSLSGGYGFVADDYRMGVHEITNGQWDKFKASLGVAVTGDPTDAYDQDAYWTGTNVPTNKVSWYEAAQFVNWLNTSTDHQAAYNFTGTQGTINYTFATWSVAEAADGTNFYRHKDAFYYLPTEDEWVKAAYFNGTTLQDSATKAGESLFQGNGSNGGWNYHGDTGPDGPDDGPWNVGSGSEELNGTYDMMGNVWEWLESPYSDPSYAVGSDRGYHGGSYQNSDTYLHASYRDGSNPPRHCYSFVGFRVASVPEPSLTSVATGNWNAAATWDDGSLIPTEENPTVVGSHTVTVTEEGSALSLLINHSGGKVVVSPTSTLTVVASADVAAGTLEIRGTLNAGSVAIAGGTVDLRGTLEAGSVEVDNGRLAIAPTGALNVDGEVTMKVGSEYACELGASTSGLVTAGGNVNLDGTLTLQAIDAGVPGPRFDQTIISTEGEGEILGNFAIVPTVHDPLMGRVGHLGLGVFHKGVNYVRSGPDPEDPVKSVSVDLYVARGGDGNGDGRVDTMDITNLVTNFGIADRNWTHNDTAGGTTGHGDGKVDTLDITDLVFNFDPPFSPDPGPSAECSAIAQYNAAAGEITVIPEPSTLALLGIGAVGLVAYAWRRRRRAK